MVIPLVLALLLPAQTPPVPEEAQTPERRLATRTELDLLLSLHAKAHGGEETLLGVKNLRFDVVPYALKDGREVPTKPLHFELQFSGTERIARVEEELDGRPMVKLVDGLNGKVWVAGEERQVPELTDAAVYEVTTMLAYLDLLFRPGSLDLARRMEGVRRRDGIAYSAVHMEFAPQRTGGVVLHSYRTFFHPATHLVDRIDIHDSDTKRRSATVRVEGYRDLGGLKFPTRLVFHDRDGQPLAGWIFEHPEVNAAIPPERFLAP